MKNVVALVLAAGRGTRMNGELPKVLYPMAQKPLIYWPLTLLEKIGIKKVYVITGYKSDEVKKAIKDMGFKVSYIYQEKLLGTANSVKVSLPLLPKSTKNILILFGDDSALYKPKTIRNFIEYHLRKKNKATLLTLERKAVSDIGGLKADSEGRIVGVLTQSEILKSKVKKHQILCGAFLFNKKWIEENLPDIKPSEFSGEYPLPGIIKLAAQKNEPVDGFKLTDITQWYSVNSKAELKEAEKLKMAQLKN